MIAGIFIRNYKCYSNINFIPFVNLTLDKLNVFVGENGIGKSSILESLNCILNEINPRNWETTLGQKRDRTYIGPVFLIKKSEMQETKQINAISDAFWKTNFVEYNNSDSTKAFVKWRDKLAGTIQVDDYYLICIGKDSLGNILLTTTFHKKITDQTKWQGVSKEYISNLFNKILSLYSYIYIPVENRISDVLNLQASEMQGLMDKSVVDEIKTLLSSKEHEAKEAGKKNSIVDLINLSLDKYIAEINSNVPVGYKFEAKGTNKKTIKPNDILNAILSEYFSIRPLTKDGKHIKSLSSGQQRLALMDIAATMLSTTSKKNKKIILAIDEPESSLEASNRFEQFSRLVEISEERNHQVLLTTHWYGLLLRPSKAQLNFVSKTEESPEIRNYSMRSLYDERRHFPDSIEMKSYFDLMSSMLSLLKKGKHNWLICEGYEDSVYLNLYLKPILNNTYILPFNGSGNVKKLFQFLSVPFSDKGEQKSIVGRVMCLIDTDEKSLITIQGYKASKYANKLAFNRLSFDRDKMCASLVSVANTNATNTEIEDLLDPEIMWEAISNLRNNDDTLDKFMKEYSYKEDIEYTDLTKNIGFLEKTSKKAYEKFDDFKLYLHEETFKKQLADEYFAVATNKHNPGYKVMPWMDEIVKYFNE